MSTSKVWLRRLSARDFRNFEKLDLAIPESGLAIIGENGQGKTNLLESIYYLQVLRSVRGARENLVAIARTLPHALALLNE